MTICLVTRCRCKQFIEVPDNFIVNHGEIHVPLETLKPLSFVETELTSVIPERLVRRFKREGKYKIPFIGEFMWVYVEIV